MNFLFACKHIAMTTVYAVSTTHILQFLLVDNALQNFIIKKGQLIINSRVKGQHSVSHYGIIM